MEPTQFTFPFFLLLFTSASAKQPQYQTLVVTPLSDSQIHEPEHLLWSIETTKIDRETTLLFPLEHRDSFSFNQTEETLFHLRLSRDAARIKSINDLIRTAVQANVTHAHGSGSRSDGFSSPVISGLSQGSGEYFTRLGVGTPPRYSYMSLDTGSDVVWIQCLPCKNCYFQSDPVFDPKKSNSFAVQPCGSPLCRNLEFSKCDQQRSCLYEVFYGDGSFTVGEFATETITFGVTKVPNVAFGCGHVNEGLFIGSAGLLGLGRGRLSFLNQIGNRYGHKFSYCLLDRSSASKSSTSSIVFGNSSVPKIASFTPMIRNPKLDTFYYLQLVGISVGGNRVAGISSSLFRIDPAGQGGVIIDSGTSVTRLTQPAYVALRNAFRAGASELKRAPGFSLFDTCYDLAGKMTVRVPTVVMHFSHAVDLALPASNYLVPVDPKGIFCFAFAGTSAGLSVIGNIQQQGFRIVFDGSSSRIGFAPHGCA